MVTSRMPKTNDANRPVANAPSSFSCTIKYKKKKQQKIRCKFQGGRVRRIRGALGNLAAGGPH